MSWDIQRDFARVTGDYNPIHMSDIAARRTQAGRALTHGMHSGLWALDALIAKGTCPPDLETFKVKFSRMVFVGETVGLRVTRQNGPLVSAQVGVGDLLTATVSAKSGTRRKPVTVFSSANAPALSPVSAADLTLDEMKDLRGHIGLEAGAEVMFPSAAKALGITRVRALGALSKLVGMQCPGLHSIASSYDVTFVEGGEDDTELNFEVSDIDERFRLVTQSVRGGGIEATVIAVARVPPVEQPQVAELAKLVRTDEFAGIDALTIGGSRGLGELAAKIVAAGGGRNTITYVAGKQDAEAVCDEIRSRGGVCDAVHYDVRERPEAQLGTLSRVPTHLFYFATNVIAGRSDEVFSHARFDEFCGFYVTGFEQVCRALMAQGAVALTVLYPSSIFVEERPAGMTEYAMAKAAGEVLCADLSRTVPGLKIRAVRLPRMLTDQTATATPLDTADATEVLLPIIREISHADLA